MKTKELATDELLKMATPRPWVVDDRHIHTESGLTYPTDSGPETDIILLVDTDCHENGLLTPTDEANLELVRRATSSFEAMREALKGLLTHAPAPSKNVRKEYSYLIYREAAKKALALSDGFTILEGKAVQS